MLKISTETNVWVTSDTHFYNKLDIYYKKEYGMFNLFKRTYKLEGKEVML